MSQNKVDVFVIGGGPAGLAAAVAASQKGFSVTLADGASPHIDKACGEGLLPDTHAALQALGVELHSAQGHQFRGIQFVHGHRYAHADFPQGPGLGVRRPLLHKLLLERAEMCGVQLLWKTPVLGVGSNGVKLEGRTVPARWVIGADGGSSRVRKWIGLEAGARNTMRFATRRHYRVRPWSEYMEIYWGHETQAYVTPISPEEVCVVIMAETKWASGFDSALRDQPHLRERLKGAELASRERGAVSEALRLKHVFRGNVALLGDASGSVDAITGEGLRLAFRQSAILAEAMRRGDLASYAVAHQRLARRPLWMGSLMLQFGKRAGLRERTMRILAKRPELFTRLLSIHLGHARPRHILSTGAKLGWQFLTATEPS